ncbi:MAG: helix-turn-helix domain-containing protein [Aeromicrobium sp.]|uniref:helix-turn-helix domain-containing protein n=1 Tax=Aeromicrobium sp. TaxID=1871063 RepID=UPI0039E69712
MASGDEADLADLLGLRATVEEAIETAVLGLRAQGHSWAYIAAGLGVTRQAAQMRYAKACRDQ